MSYDLADDPVARKAVLDACHRALAGRTLTEHELATRLRGKGHPEQMIVWAIERCHANRLLDDDAYARTFVRQRTARGHGPRKVRMDLAKRGITGDLAEAAFEALGDDEATRPDPVGHCVDLLRRRFDPEQLAETKIRAKAFRLLISRGFDSDHAERAIGIVREADAT